MIGFGAHHEEQEKCPQIGDHDGIIFIKACVAAIIISIYHVHIVLTPDGLSPHSISLDGSRLNVLTR